MAIAQASASDLVTEIRRIIGQVDADLSTDLPNVRILDMLNRYIQGLTHKVSDFIRAEGGSIKDGTIKLIFWRQTWVGDVTGGDDVFILAAGSSSFDLPNTFDYLESIYDTTHERELEEVREINKHTTRGRMLRDRPAGPPEAYELLGYTTSSTRWVQQGTLYPSTAAGVTPTLILTGYRKPAILTSQATPSGSEFLDIDPEYDQIAILGTVVSILSAGDPMVEEYKAQERAMLGQLAMTAVRVN